MVCSLGSPYKTGVDIRALAPSMWLSSFIYNHFFIPLMNQSVLGLLVGIKEDATGPILILKSHSCLVHKADTVSQLNT